ncbi:fimbrial protein [Pantoea sp. y20]
MNYLSLLSFFIFAVPLCSQADSFGSNRDGGLLTSRITMDVSAPTCSVNAEQGVARTIQMGQISREELIAGKGKAMNAPLTVDCSASGTQAKAVEVSVRPAGSSKPADNTEGLLETSLPGVGLQMSWHDGKLVSFATDSSRRFEAGNSQIWELAITAKPVATITEFVSGGRYVGTISVNLTYL